MINNLDSRNKILLCAMALLGILALSKPLAELTISSANEGLVQSGGYFALVRLLNAIVSMFQGVEINFILSSLPIGELLDPVNDLVEYVSTGLKLAIASYLLQRIMIEIVTTWLFNLIFSVFILGCAITLFIGSTSLKNFFFRATVFLAFLRFSVVFVMLATSLFSQAFIDEKIAVTSDETLKLSNQLDESRQVAENVSDDLSAELFHDIERLKLERSTVLIGRSELLKKEKSYQYQIDKLERELDSIKSVKSSFENIKNSIVGGDTKISRVEDEIESQELKRNQVSKDIDELDDKLERIESDIAFKSENLFEESNGFLAKLTGGIQESKDYILELGTDLADSMMTALVLFLFKMLLLPILFLLASLKVFKWIWLLSNAET